MWSDPYDLAGLGDGPAVDFAAGTVGGQVPDATLYDKVTGGAPIAANQIPSTQVAVQPTTQAQVFGLIDAIAKGILDVKKTEATTALSTAQARAAAEQSKVQAQNYVMQQLQQGKAVMVDKSWLEKYGPSTGLTKWLSPILIIGGVGLLVYAGWRLYSQRRTKAANPRKRKKRRTCPSCGSNPCVC